MGGKKKRLIPFLEQKWKIAANGNRGLPREGRLCLCHPRRQRAAEWEEIWVTKENLQCISSGVGCAGTNARARGGKRSDSTGCACSGRAPETGNQGYLFSAIGFKPSLHLHSQKWVFDASNNHSLHSDRSIH